MNTQLQLEINAWQELVSKRESEMDDLKEKIEDKDERIFSITMENKRMKKRIKELELKLEKKF
jgi:predicted  nucleic acid-binding Zn-ribbon protein